LRPRRRQLNANRRRTEPQQERNDDQSKTGNGSISSCGTKNRPESIRTISSSNNTGMGNEIGCLIGLGGRYFWIPDSATLNFCSYKTMIHVGLGNSLFSRCIVQESLGTILGTAYSNWSLPESSFVSFQSQDETQRCDVLHPTHISISILHNPDVYDTISRFCNTGTTIFFTMIESFWKDCGAYRDQYRCAKFQLILTHKDDIHGIATMSRSR
jgi:hypothetical protein